MPEKIDKVFKQGAQWVRADFHLHTRADKEFHYEGDDDRFVSSYIEKLEASEIKLGVITNHNKFDMAEFKALRKKARKSGIALLPGVELSVNDGSNGVHTLVVFSDSWLEGGEDYINSFLSVAFSGKVRSTYERENGRSNDDVLETLKKLENFNRDFFIVFAHVEANSGLWAEIKGGRLAELAEQPLMQKYALGFQKVRTHFKDDIVCRTKVQNWWGDSYPAELEGSDPKSLTDIGRGRKCYLKLGDLGFSAVKFALLDRNFRVSNDVPKIEHSHINSIRFEGGLHDGQVVDFSPHLNCIIGIQGSGKSSVLESLRFALDIPFGEKAQDIAYKKSLLPHVLRSGGKVVVGATDQHGQPFEIRRILGHSPEVYIDGSLQSGVSVRETIIAKPLYFGQKDLSAAGKDFGNDLVEKLMGDSLNVVRQGIRDSTQKLEETIDNFLSLQNAVEEKDTFESELKDVEFRLVQFDRHGIRETLEKQLAFNSDLEFCRTVERVAGEWHETLNLSVTKAEEKLEGLNDHSSTFNANLFERHARNVAMLVKNVGEARGLVGAVSKTKTALEGERITLEGLKDGLKEEFAKTERELVTALEGLGVTSIEPDAYVDLVARKGILVRKIAELDKSAAKAETKHDEVISALSLLNDCWLEEYTLIEKKLRSVVELQKALTFTGDFKGNKSVFTSHIESLFKGHNLRKEYYNTLCDAYADFGEVFRELEVSATHAKSKADSFKTLFFLHLKELLTFQVPNNYSIKYHGRLLESHSLGQRASAMMLFLLSQQGNDLLLIDQPEDDLDSQTIYAEVVKLLRALKSTRQFIFTTHNANFPVLGDAETIITCSEEDGLVSLDVGTIDDPSCQGNIIKIMEGGPEAFERRKSIYQIWTTEIS